MYDMQLSYINNGTPADGTDVAKTTYLNLSVEAKSRKGCSMALARKLLALGAPDGPYRALRGSKVCFFGSSLYRLAQRTIIETDEGVFKDGRFKAMTAEAKAARVRGRAKGQI